MSTTKPSNIPSIERATGTSWATWLTHFATNEASTKPHAQIARIALDHMPDGVANPEWWAQGVAIAYEQHAGIRVPGQSSTGTFQVSVSTTVTGNRDQAIEDWAEVMASRPKHRGHTASTPRRSRTEKRTFWRVDLQPPEPTAASARVSKVEVAASDKGEGKVLVSIQHRDLTHESDIETWRAHWKEQLASVYPK